jgi:proteasome lid subunit RPN8/RPN11
MTDGTDAAPVASGNVPRALRIPENIYRAMIDQSRRESPLECCGVLGGTETQVHSIHPLRNVAASQTRYAADEQQLVEAHRWLRDRQWQIVAIYHSHPRWPAVPSKTDLELNYWGDMPRIIVSLLVEPAEIRVWRLAADSFQELPWTLVEPLQAPADSLQVAPKAD